MLLRLVFSPLSSQGKEYVWGTITIVKKAGIWNKQITAFEYGGPKGSHVIIQKINMHGRVMVVEIHLPIKGTSDIYRFPHTPKKLFWWNEHSSVEQLLSRIRERAQKYDLYRGASDRIFSRGSCTNLFFLAGTKMWSMQVSHFSSIEI